ncbi:MAG: hypothetical protein JGK04_09200 [Microcoleus sp. PH2017_39_LGB_O_B]|uniref:hypothetical protein n=1 Tax=unclassified Microcoleus TaxID=2642155 RepID=UPI001D2B4684|nr:MULTISPECIES: hypothetical protein [unclassified Microcoleus]MCC3467649.1 hypothetical protein [Microcoleus sp. PH2017_06_SFM_O_A]TAF90517.1 MAG: hypothetical protein EAZ49_08365 [Oscillatoriales cyanobacterium]MCC3447671.1 hypothetical protein [Microcoleus sp. PH2017_09_SFU_O_A]MCC3628604.1 hypothetical protein [Microcoleus sp. PH2017_39_LGB_O_B]MCC3640687.1 hypothetical protein [Microcoleus sp. PH2017_33_LGB_O_A]
MARHSFLVKYRRSGADGTGTDDFRTTCSCIPRVANFLDIKSRSYTPSPEDVTDRAGYTRSYIKADGSTGEVTVPASKAVYLAFGRPNARKVSLTTGLKTTKGNKRKLSFTFPSFLTVAEIADILGELIPATKIATTATVGAGEIEPFFSIKGGRTYPIASATVAAASANPDVATTETEQATTATTTKSKKKKPKVTP